MKPNSDNTGNPVNVCVKCIHVDVDVGMSPCTPSECEISAILAGTFQYLNTLKKDAQVSAQNVESAP